MSTDPAIIAAQRAWDERYPNGSGNCVASAQQRGIGVLAIGAAREALKPIRELHHIVEPNSRYLKCSTCEYDWSCATAYLAYTTKELER